MKKSNPVRAQYKSSTIQIDDHLVIVANEQKNESKIKTDSIDSAPQIERQRSISSSNRPSFDEKADKVRSFSSSTQDKFSPLQPPPLVHSHPMGTAFTKPRGESLFRPSTKKLADSTNEFSSTTTITPRSLSSVAASSPSYATSTTSTLISQEKYLCSTSIVDLLIILMRYKDSCEQLIDLIAPANLLEHSNKFFQSRFNCYNNLYSVSFIGFFFFSFLIYQISKYQILVEEFSTFVFFFKFRKYSSLSTYIPTIYWLVSYNFFFILFFF
jgi:hypothetical protein